MLKWLYGDIQSYPELAPNGGDPRLVALRGALGKPLGIPIDYYPWSIWPDSSRWSMSLAGWKSMSNTAFRCGCDYRSRGQAGNSSISSQVRKR